MSITEIVSVAASGATVLAALGVIYASRQAVTAFEQLTHSKDSQAVALHSGFQREFREWQKLLPPSASRIDWVPASDDERRLIQLYWELVFDEWYTCTQVSREERVQALWTAYSKGVEGAFRRKAFTDSLVIGFSQRTSYLGLSLEFKEELTRCFQNVHHGQPAPF